MREQKSREQSAIGKKRILYIVCFAFLCLIDQRTKTGSWHDGLIESYRDMTGIVMAVLVLAQYRWKDFEKNKWLYVTWGLLSAVGGVVFVLKGQDFTYYLNNRIVDAMDVFLWGIIVIQIVQKLMFGGEAKKAQIPLKRFVLVAWLAMMGLMCAFRWDIHWPAGYLIMFGCFYLTDFSPKEREELFRGAVEGIILGFVLMQGWTLVFRPYDSVRYVGVYANCNLNALFYLVVLAAVLIEVLYLHAESGADKGYNGSGDAGSNIDGGGDTGSNIDSGGEYGSMMFRRKRWLKWCGWIAVGIMLGFIFMTISRTGYLTATVLVAVALFMQWIVAQGRTAGPRLIKTLIQSGAAIVLCTVLMFPVVFCAVRYLPAVFHHPIWFWGEWNEDKVHSWDKWDSEKYIDFDEFIGTAAKRVSDILFKSKAGVVEAAGENVAEQMDTAMLDAESLGVESIGPGVEVTKPEDVTALQWQRYQEMLKEGYGIPLEQMANGEENSTLIRSTIYRYYLHHLRLTGHSKEEQGFQILPTYWIGHAHNIYLQWGVEFGIPVMVLFVVLNGWTMIRLMKELCVKRDLQAAGYLLFLLVPCVFGLLEYCWGAGSLTILLMFMAWGRGMYEGE